MYISKFQVMSNTRNLKTAVCHGPGCPVLQTLMHEFFTNENEIILRKQELPLFGLQIRFFLSLKYSILPRWGKTARKWFVLLLSLY